MEDGVKYGLTQFSLMMWSDSKTKISNVYLRTYNKELQIEKDKGRVASS